MLDLLRRKAQSPYIQATVLVIIVVFLFWVPNSGNGPGQSAVATVNDQAITRVEYQKAYDQTVDRVRKQFGGSLPANLLDSLGIKEQVVNDLIQRVLVGQAAQEMGILVSDDEVRSAIQDMETFKNNGVFDLSWYQQVLTSSRIGVTDFEAGMRSDLITGKVMEQVKKLARVANVEVDERLTYDYGEKKFSFVEFAADDFKKDVTVTDEGLAVYYEKHQDTYKTAPQVKINYLLFPFGKDGAAVKLADADIEKYYNDHSDEFLTPEKRRASHILIKSGAGDSDAQKAEKKKKAAAILAKAKAGEDFAKLAKENSQDSTASNGGDLGFFAKGMMVKPFDDSVFSMQVNDISLVETRYGFHVIKLVKIEDSFITPLTKVRGIIAAKIKKEQGQSIAFRQANDAYEKIILSGSMNTFAGIDGADIIKTDLFTRNTPPPAIKTRPALLAKAFSLRKGELSSLIEDRTSYAIVYINDVKTPQVPKLAEVQDRVTKDFVAGEAKKLAQTAADKLLAAVKAGADLNAEAADLKLPVQESAFVSRANRAVKKLPAQLLDSVFDLSATSKYPEKSIENGGNYYVVAFKEAQELGADVLAKKREKLEKKLKQESEINLLTAWSAYLRSQAEITINRQFL